MGTVKHADYYAKAWLPEQEILLGMLSAYDPGSNYTTLSTGTTSTTTAASTTAASTTAANTTAASTIASNYCMADGAPWYSPSRSVAVNLKPRP